MALRYVFLFTAAFAFLSVELPAAEKRRELGSAYEVPTTGKIMDVQYVPDFDEWWIKCKEGDTIAIYSYDKKNQRWGKIVFSPKKQDEPSRGTDRKQPEGETGDTKPTDGKSDTPSKPADKRPEKQTEKPRWWDPLSIIKSGEKLIVPQSSDGKK